MIWTSGVKDWNVMSKGEQGAMYYAWTYGLLRYKLDPLQRQVRQKIDDYFARFDGTSNSFARFYVLDMSRRLGKDFIKLCKMCEELATHTDGIYVYATAYYKQLIEILEPLLQKILMDCPPDLRLKELKYRHHWEHPKTRSILKMVGLDMNPDSMRGPRCDGAVITEAAYCENLKEAESAFLPQLLDNTEAWRIYGSTPSGVMSHKWETEIIPEAKAKGNYSYHILDESPRYTTEQIEAAYEEFGGRDSEQSKLEYLCLHLVSKEKALIPEWSQAKSECCVDSYPRPDVAHAYLGLDPGMSDLSGIPAGYYDFENDMLVIEAAEAEQNLNTEQLANLIKDIEKRLGWKDFRYFTPDGRSHPNPFKRVCDRDPRVIADLHELYGLLFEPALKHDLEAGIALLRTRIAKRKIRIIKSGCQKLIAQLDSAIWNKRRTSPEKTDSPILGHFDIVMGLVYLNRSIDKTVNPFNPYVTYPSNYHIVYPQERTGTGSGWIYRRDHMGNIIQ